ncbi:transporter substrate-binding domain-containing protein [Rubrivirga sp. S365]|uniref:ion channel n=1 Tax=Rubrivirga sp. S365 TaxID=3076080 RepID=UPI0028C638EA|nr:transporter substrate-binding domain-containing protein [Rubrivirga sp. S365]MDT7855819.1 transporter substrate-binding domain-containing protein [Rubrivirga sp. S365]
MIRLLLALVLLLASAPAASAQTAPPAPSGGDLRVAVAPAPPFVEAGTDSTWDGLGVHLAREVGTQLGRSVQFVRADDPVAAVAGGAADLAVATMTAEDEDRVDFTAPFYSARLGMARETGSGIAEVAKRFFSPTFFKIALGLVVLLFLIGLAMWGIERHEDENEIREEKAGIWDGFWWAGVTMTTIGYGDTVPQTTGGRALALVWMIVSLAVTSALTAALVSALGIGSGSGGGASFPDDLRGERVGVVAGSAAEAVLAESRVTARPYPSLAAGLDAVEADSLDLFVDSVPRLKVATSETDRGLRVETTGFEYERWALAAPQGSDLREAVTRAVLERVQSPDWPPTVARYLP